MRTQSILMPHLHSMKLCLWYCTYIRLHFSLVLRLFIGSQQVQELRGDNRVDWRIVNPVSTHVCAHTHTPTFTDTLTHPVESKGYAVSYCAAKPYRMSHQLWDEHMQQLSHTHAVHKYTHTTHTDIQNTWTNNLNKRSLPFPSLCSFKCIRILTLKFTYTHWLTHIYIHERPILICCSSSWITWLGSGYCVCLRWDGRYCTILYALTNRHFQYK